MNCKKCNKLIDPEYWEKFRRYNRDWFDLNPSDFCSTYCWYESETTLFTPRGTSDIIRSNCGENIISS